MRPHPTFRLDPPLSRRLPSEVVWSAVGRDLPPPARPGPRVGLHRGSTAEWLTLGAALLLATALVLPPTARAVAGWRLHGAADEVIGKLRIARFKAVYRGHGIAVRIANAPGGELLYALFGDSCAESAVCGENARPLLGWQRLAVARGVRLGVPHGRAVRDPLLAGRYLAGREDAADLARVRFDAFGAVRDAAALYLTDGERLIAVRIEQGAGAAAIVVYDFEREIWR
jgi:hypothetical protein